MNKGGVKKSGWWVGIAVCPLSGRVIEKSDNKMTTETSCPEHDATANIITSEIELGKCDIEISHFVALQVKLSRTESS